MTNQDVIDLLVLTMNDVDVINLYQKEKCCTAQEAEMWVAIHLMIERAIDYTYGDGSFAKWQNSGVLPSQQ